MSAYVLHVVDRRAGKMTTRSSADPHTFDFVYEVLAGPYAGQRGTHRELSELFVTPLVVLSSKVAICRDTGTLLDWVETDSTDATGQWVQRHRQAIERTVGV